MFRRPRPPVAALVLALSVAPVAARAQDAATADSLAALRARLEALESRLEGMTEETQTLRSDVDRLRSFKFSGYVQARWETAEGKRDSVEVKGSPPSFTPANTERFVIRRARLKLTYDASPWSEAVVYLDAGQDRTVRLVEAHVTLLDPWTPTHQHRLTVGQMNVPFGYELERSSSARELPERSRAENLLFPGERDRGIKLVSLWTPLFETTFAVMNGAGIASAEFPSADPNRAKDLVARARVSQGVLDGALSAVVGRTLTALTGPDVVTRKNRLGVDGQAYWELPRVGGGTLRAELYAGHEVNPDSVKALTVTGAAGRVLRSGADPASFATDVQGGYVMWVQSLGESFQAAARYDWFDPNVDREHDQFERLGVGLHAFWGGLTRVTVAYDVPRTDVAAAGGYRDPHDNLWTVQVQHRF